MFHGRDSSSSTQASWYSYCHNTYDLIVSRACVSHVAYVKNYVVKVMNVLYLHTRKMQMKSYLRMRR